MKLGEEGKLGVPAAEVDAAADVLVARSEVLLEGITLVVRDAVVVDVSDGALEVVVSAG